jgi:hypothetical protein
MRNSTKKSALISILGMFLLMGYQNCSKIGVADIAPANNLTQTGTPESGNPFNPSQTPEFKCQSIQMISLPSSGALNIPARGDDGVCYAVKLINKSNWSPSNNNPNSDQQVISRNHASSIYNDPSLIHAPYLLGSALLDVYLQGERSILLSGGANASSNITVDNFVLIGVMPSSQNSDPHFYKAYGTADSTVIYNGNTDNIMFMNQAVALTPFASGGTSTIKPLAIDGEMQVKQNYTLDIRAEDCGGSGNNSDIYLVFQ